MKPLIKGIILFATLLLILTACKKKKAPPEPSTYAFIDTFYLTTKDNPSLSQDVVGIITRDSVYLQMSSSVNLTSLVPTITFLGASMSPESKAVQNFTNTLSYTVIAESGFTKIYKVVTRVLSNAKEITSFIFKKADNPQLANDIVGVISGDSILMNLPSGIGNTSLVPTITFAGAAITPENRQARDFSDPTYYGVIAEDGTSRTYHVFAGMTKSIFAMSEDGYLYSISTSNGAQQWRYFIGGGFGDGVPTYSNGTVFVARVDNTVFALNALDGSLKWTSPPMPFNYGLTIPAVANNKVYFAGVAENTGLVMALNAQTGIQEWVNFIPGNFNPTNITVKDNQAYVYDVFSELRAYDASNGTQLWWAAGMLGRANPAISNNNTIICGVEGGMQGISTSGQLLWQLFSPNPNNNPTVFTSSTIKDNVVYSVGMYNLLLFAIDIGGSVKWQAPLNSNGGGYTVSAPFLYNNNLYVLDGDKGLSSYSADNGSFKWRKTSFISQPVVTNNEIYICNDGKRITCLNAATGDVKWTTPVNANFSNAVCVVDGNGNAYHITDSGEQQ